MALDPSIIMQAGRGVEKPRNMLQQYGNVLALRNAQEESEMRRAAMEQQAAQRRALSGAVGPDGAIDDAAVTRALAGAGDVRGLSSWQTSRSTMAKNKAAGDKSRLEFALKTLDTVGQFLGGAKTREEYASNLQGLRGVLGAEWNPPGDLVVDPEAWTPEASQRIGQLAMSQKERLEQEWKQKNFGLSERKTVAAEQGKYGTNVTVNPEGVETVAPDKTVARKAQQGIQAGWETLGRLKRMRETYNPEFLTYSGGVRAAVGQIADKAGVASEGQRRFIQERRRFTQNLNQEFNAYRKEITGAAASVQELESLKKAMMSEDLSPAEFEAAFDEYLAELARGMRIKARLLREGVRVGTSEFGEQFDRLFIGGGDDDISARAQELEAEGLDEKAGEERLKQEGYL